MSEAIVICLIVICLSAYVGLSLWALVANQITYHRITKEIDAVHQRRVEIIDACIKAGDLRVMRDRTKSVGYPENGTYLRLFWRTLFFRRYDDILPLTGGE